METRFQTKYIERNCSRIDEGTMGFHDYVDKYEPLSDFFERVNRTMTKLQNVFNFKITGVQYLVNSSDEIYAAIITMDGE